MNGNEQVTEEEMEEYRKHLPFHVHIVDNNEMLLETQDI